MKGPDDQPISPAPAPRDTPTKSDETLVLCKLDDVRTIVTTYSHCVDILRGQVVGKVPPTELISCSCAEGTVSTTAADCTGKLNGTVQPVTPPGS